jgi:hypothetical protein
MPGYRNFDLYNKRWLTRQSNVGREASPESKIREGKMRKKIPAQLIFQ